MIQVDNVTKKFRIPIDKSSGLKQQIVNLAKRRRGYREFTALSDVSFEVKQGDFFGIVGRNGSGKSTLLKTIAQIYVPDNGGVAVNGSLVPFIELGVGFNPELSGRENVYLNGALLGFSHDEVAAMYDDIVDFAEMGDFIEEKLKNYSSGMQVRLAFSIAIRARGDILLLDEVLAVGDEAFQRKCNDYFDTIRKDKSQTVILVTHNMGAVRQYCNKAILLEDGKLTVAGSPEDIANKYTEINFETESKGDKKMGDDGYEIGLSSRVPYFKVKPAGKKILSYKDNLVFDVEYEITDDEPVMTAFSIIDEVRGGTVLANRAEAISGKGKHKLRYVFPLELYNDSNFLVTAVLDEKKDLKRIAFTNDTNSCRFAVRNDVKFGSLLRPYGPAHGHWEGLKDELYDSNRKKVN